MKCIRIAIMLFVLASVGSVLAGGMSDSAVKTMLDKASKFYDAKEYAKAVEIYDQLGDYIKSGTNDGELYNIACTYSLVGRKDRALEVLKQAVARGWLDDGHMADDHDLDSIRNEPAYQQILADIKARNAKMADSVDAALATWVNPGMKKQLGGRDFEQIGAGAQRVRAKVGGITGFTPFKGRLYIMYVNDVEPMQDSGIIVTSFNPADGQWRWGLRALEYWPIRRFRPIGDYLYLSGSVMDESSRPRDSRKFANLYGLAGDGSYVRYHDIPDATGITDIAGLDGQLFVTIAEAHSPKRREAVLRSTDGGLSWASSYEFNAPGEEIPFARSLVAYRNRLYAFRTAHRNASSSIFVRNAYDGKEAVVYDGATWTETDLIADADLARVWDTRVFRDQLVMLGQHHAPGSDSSNQKTLRSIVYVWNGEGKVVPTFQTGGFDCQNWFSNDDALYILTRTGEVYFTKDLKKFDLLLTLPKDVNATAVGAHDGWLYVGCKNGDVYRTKL
jgi:hypothetical protein